MVRVLIVDDEALVRSGLRLILESAPDIDVVAACEGRDAIDQSLAHRPDVVLLDIRMPDVDGLTILAELRRQQRPPIVAMLTTFDADEHVTAALRAGATGFLLKDTEPEQLVHSVRALASGGSVLSPSVTRTVIGGYVDGGVDESAARRLDALTERERAVLVLLADGLSNAEIAATLFLGVATVKDYVSTVLTKLGASNRVQAAVLAHRAGIVRSARTGQT